MPEVDAPLTDEQLGEAFPGQDITHLRSMMGKSAGEANVVSPNADDKGTGAEGEPDVYPDFIPEKFRNGTIEEATKAMAEAYSSLETKLGTQSGKPAAGEADTGAEGVEGEVDEGEGTSLSDVEEFFVANGEISEAMYTEFEGKGMEPDVLDAYITGQQALATGLVTAVHASAGGPDAYAALIEWADVNWPGEQVESFDATIARGDKQATLLAVRGLQADYKAAMGSDPTLVAGDGNGNPTGKSYASRAEMTAAMKDPRYAKDPAYRKEVEETIGNSDIW